MSWSWLDIAAMRDVLASAEEIAATPDVLFVDSEWVSNGARGTVHAHAGSDRAECTNFFPRPSASLRQMSVRQVTAGPQEFCGRCVRRRVRQLTTANDIAVHSVFRQAVQLREVQAAAAAAQTPTEREKARVAATRIARELASMPSASLPARTARWVAAAVPVAEATASALAEANAVDRSGVHADAVEVLLEAWQRDMALGDVQKMTFGGVGHRSDLSHVFSEWRKARDGDPVERRLAAIRGLVGDLVDVKQLTHLDPARVAAAMTGPAVTAATAGAGVLAALRQEWLVFADAMAGDLVDVWEARHVEWLAGTAEETVLMSVPSLVPWDLVAPALASGTRLQRSGPMGVTLEWVTVTRSTRQALELSAYHDGPGVPAALYVHVVPEGTPAVVVETALGVWTPWEGDSALGDAAAALEAARVLMSDSPARQVSVSRRTPAAVHAVQV